MVLANLSNRELVCCFHISISRDLLVLEFEILQSIDPIHDMHYKMLIVYV